MCRWLAYLGSPIPLDDVLVKPDHSLIDQSRLARDLYLPGVAMAAQFRGHAFPTNGDGSEQNCHPFVHGGWMFQHNGEVSGFARVKRDLTMAVDPELYPFILGITDSEVCFYLALTYGLAEDPVGGLTRMVQHVEHVREKHGIAEPFRATMCASDGRRLLVLRWISPDVTGQQAPSLYHSAGARLHFADGGNGAPPEDAQLVVSEPVELHWSPRTWHEIPAGVIGVFEPGADPTLAPVAPVAPATGNCRGKGRG